MTQLQFSYQYQNPIQWLEHFNNSFPSTLDGQRLFLEKPFGEGWLSYEVIQDGLWVQFLNFKVFSPVLIQRESIKKNDIFVVDFYLSENVLHQTIDNCKDLSYSYLDINMLFSSSSVEADIKLEANKWMNIVQILFTKEWLTKNVNLDNYRLKDIIHKDQPICFSENLDHRLKAVIGNVTENPNHKLNLASNIYQILDHIFFKFNGRNLSVPRKNIHGEDTEKLFKAKSYLDKNVCEHVSIKLLCELIQMSRSKFKRLFSQIFGKPPYRYHLENKLELGKELIETRKFTISEAAYFIGYDDHGSFTRAFKKHYGYLPSEL